MCLNNFRYSMIYGCYLFKIFVGRHILNEAPYQTSDAILILQNQRQHFSFPADSLRGTRECFLKPVALYE